MTRVSMNLSIIIVNWNTRDMLRDCLASLPAATEGLVTEILVVDNASSDGSAAMVGDEFPGVRLIESGGNLGFSRANNLALAQTSGDGILLLNPDTVCPPLCLVRMFRFMNGKENVGAVGPRLVDGTAGPRSPADTFPAPDTTGSAFSTRGDSGCRDPCPSESSLSPSGMKPHAGSIT